MPPCPDIEHENFYLDEAPEYNIAELLAYDFRPAAPAITSSTLEDMIFCGLRNLTNTCYAHALLNALTKIPLCRSWFASHQQRFVANAAHVDTCMLCKLAADTARLCTMPFNDPFAPQSVLARARWNDDGSFDNFLQHDANEAFQALMNACDACDVRDFLSLGIVERIPTNYASTYNSLLAAFRFQSR